MSEAIVFAAIKVHDVIYTGWRHCHIIRNYCEITGHSKCPATNWPNEHISNQGFVTSTGRFVDRKEALAIAKAAGQIIKKQGNANNLYSEDLWSVTGVPHGE